MHDHQINAWVMDGETIIQYWSIVPGQDSAGTHSPPAVMHIAEDHFTVDIPGYVPYHEDGLADALAAAKAFLARQGVASHRLSFLAAPLAEYRRVGRDVVRVA